jgi:hypothetical protein
VLAAAVRVEQASIINPRDVLVFRTLRQNQSGGFEPARVLARALKDVRVSVSNAPVGETAGEPGSGNLRARVKTATLHGLRFGPVCPDM